MDLIKLKEELTYELLVLSKDEYGITDIYPHIGNVGVFFTDDNSEIGISANLIIATQSSTPIEKITYPFKAYYNDSDIKNLINLLNQNARKREVES